MVNFDLFLKDLSELMRASQSTLHQKSVRAEVAVNLIKCG